MTDHSRQGRSGEDAGPGGDSTDERVLEIVRAMADELHPGRRGRYKVTLSSGLDRDLGFDSLARVELLGRINSAFRVDVDESVLESAETPADLLDAVNDAGPRRARVQRAAKQAESTPLAAVESLPAEAGTLVEVLTWHANEHPERPHAHLLESDGAQTVLTYQELQSGAAAVAAGLAHQGLSPGGSVAIMLPTSADYLYCFFGVLMAGGVPVPIYPPARASQIEEHLRRHAGILDNAQAALLITVPQARTVARLLEARVPTLTGVATVAELTDILTDARETPALPEPRATDTAFLQYTSGSTGAPKGVVLTHDNLLANIRAMGDTLDVGGHDVFVSWLPLYHDMGLIGAWLGSLYYGIPLVLMSPVTFLTAPVRWLRAIHDHRGTLTAAPNFGYELCLKRIEDDDVDDLDLSSLRLAFNGAEPVSPNTLREFSRRFEPAGLRAEALTPVYGLAEAAVGVAFPPLGRGWHIDRIHRDRFLRTGAAESAPDDDGNAMEFVSCGEALPGYALRVLDAQGRELPERCQGRLEFAGPSATSGYFRNPEATKGLFHDGWLDTGDLAYLAEGEVYITGRVKDTIIRAGRNLYPFELEEAVGRLPGIRAGCVAVVGARDPETTTERVVVIAETRETEDDARDALIREINGTASDVLGEPPDDVVLVPPHGVLKTSSGKIRRSAMRAHYEDGSLGHTALRPGVQMLRLALTGWALWLRRGWGRLMTLAYAAWAHAVFWMLAPAAWLVVLLAPGAGLRWRAARAFARLLLRLAGVAPVVEGLHHLPGDRPCIIVGNHASYLDGMVLMAALPVRMRFIAKAELASQRIAGPFLRRIGAAFVERFAARSSAEDARRASALLDEGSHLLYFPEGTFTDQPGLRPFRSGAFVAAAERGAPVIPVVIQGTRQALPGESRMPRRCALRVVVTPPIEAGGEGWEAAMRMRSQARQAILDHLNEPDLADAVRAP
jgi:1-acyl-sn-glycerol-3-phosphate acyltransferase